MKRFISILSILLLTSCAQYQYANKVKMVSFDDNVKKGKSVGRIEGKDCTWMVLGYWLGGQPTVDKAFMNAQDQAGALASAGLKKADAKNRLRYMNNVSTENEGWNAAGLVGKQCLVVKGAGYR